MKKSSQEIGSKLIVALIAAGIGTLVQYLIPGAWEAVFTWVKKVAATSFTWLGSPTTMPTWGVCLLALLAAVALIGVAIVTYLIIKKPREDLTFTEAQYFGVKWRWRYGQIGIYDVVSFCPRCDLQVHPLASSSYAFIHRTTYKCEDCHWNSQEFDCSHEVVVDRVTRKIQQELRQRLSTNRASQR